MKKALYICSGALLAALAALFGVWLAQNDGMSVASVVMAALVTLLFGAFLIELVRAVLGAWFADRDPDAPLQPLRRAGEAGARDTLRIGGWLLLSRIAVFVAAYLILLAMRGYEGGLFDTMESIWRRGDSPSYLGIADNWYVTEGDPQYHIVFFPFYPVLIKLFAYVTGNTFAAAMLVSLLTSVGGGMLLYRLLRLDYGHSAAAFAVALVFIAPGAFFFTAPMTESLFLLLSAACLYSVRKRRYLLAGLFGALAAFTRSPGVLLVVPMGIEAVRELIAMYKAKDARAARETVKRVAGILAVPLGICGYLLINYLTWGDPFKFLQIQQEHWSQGLGFFFNTVSYQTDYFLRYFDSMEIEAAWGLWFANLAVIFASLAVVTAAARKLRASYVGYFGVYFAVSVGATWLLSAPRYMTVAFPIALGISLMCDKRYKKVLAVTVIGAFSLLYFVGFLHGGFQIW
ncbi:MAG: glycosyltransferase family 39 protein [Clostridia bacterium]|nr:glycosyltransferase family 39 protein [Clostridia bacterium]